MHIYTHIYEHSVLKALLREMKHIETLQQMQRNLGITEFLVFSA